MYHCDVTFHTTRVRFLVAVADELVALAWTSVMITRQLQHRRPVKTNIERSRKNLAAVLASKLIQQFQLSNNKQCGAVQPIIFVSILRQKAADCSVCRRRVSAAQIGS